MMTLQAAIELLKKKDSSPTHLTLRLTSAIERADIDTFQRALSTNTTVTGIYIYADKPDTCLPKQLLDAILDVLKRNIHITDLVFKDCIIPSEFYEQSEEQLAMNNRYADELVAIAKPTISRVEFEMRERKKSFEKKLAEVEEEIKKLSSQENTRIELDVNVRNMTVVEINHLVELRKKYPTITELRFSVSIKMSENPEQVAIAVKNLIQGLTSLQFNIFHPMGENIEGAEQFAEKTWKACTNVLNIGSELQELVLSQYIDVPAATKIADALQKNQGLHSLSISTHDDDCLITLSNGLRANTTLRSLSLNNTYGCKQGLLDVCLALHAHPTLKYLKIWDNDNDINILKTIASLLKHNSTIKELDLEQYNSFPEDRFIMLCSALETNTNLRNLCVSPSPFTVNCARALNQLLTKNRTLRIFKFGCFAFSYEPTSTEAINELFSHLPIDCKLSEFNLGEVNFGDAEYINVLPSLYRILGENRNLVKFKFSFDESHVFKYEDMKKYNTQVKAVLDSNDAHRFEKICLKPIIYLSSIDSMCRKNINKRVSQERYLLLRAIEKALTHLPLKEDQSAHLEKQAMKLFMAVKAPHYLVRYYFNDTDRAEANNDPYLQQLIGRVYLALWKFYMLRDDHCKLYEHLSAAIEYPEACTRLVEMLLPDQTYLSFGLSKQQRQQYLLLLLLKAGLASDIAVSLTKKILHSLQTGKEENYGGSFVELIGADRPLSYAVLINIAKSIVVRYKDPKFVEPKNFYRALIDQLEEVLNDKSISYIERFNLLRTHPEVRVELQKRYGTYSVVCFEALILSKGQKIIYDASLEWHQEYQTYHLAEQLRLTVDKSHIEKNDFAKLAAIKRKFKECYYDIIYLTEETRSEARVRALVRERLMNLSAQVPAISAFLGTLFLQLNDIQNARKFFTQAATQGDFSEIKVLRKLAKKGELWVIDLLSQPQFTKHYPQMWLFLGNCFGRLGKLELALSYYQKTDPMTAEASVLIGNCYIKLGDDIKAITYYRQADPVINEDACAALELLAEKKQHAYLIIILADIYRRKILNVDAADGSSSLTKALRYNFKAAQAENADAKSFLSTIALNRDISQQLYAIALQLEEHPEEIELVKQLYAIAQETHPVARLEFMRLDHPPIMTQKEKVFDEQPQSFSKCLSEYFYNFSEINHVGRRMIIQPDNKDVALNICRYLNANLTLSPKEILTWLREKAINNKQRVSGEFARMFCCAIVQLKKWSAKTLEHKPVVSPLLPPARAA